MFSSSTLTLRFLGEPRVVYRGEVRPFPPSKKTRALLAYLALNPKRFRRDTLCELLWEIPDDPKGSLRWSLSKLRKLVDDEQNSRIVADRTQVGFDPVDTAIDIQALQSLCDNNFADLDIDDLKKAANEFSGHFLEGLEFPNFPEFYLWCIAQREKTTQCQALLLSALIQRLNNDEAIAYARRLIGLVPGEEQHHILLINLLVSLNRQPDAEQQVALSERMLREAGNTNTHHLTLALRTATPIATPMAAPVSSAITPTVDAITSAGSSERIPFKVSLDDALAYSRRRLFGRQADVEQLVMLFKQCVEKPVSKLVLVRGEPGIGKSAFIDTTTRLAQKSDAWLLHADTFESEIVRPFALWIDAFRASSRHSVPASLSGDENLSRDKIFAGLSELIGKQAEQRPVIIIFDDVQWCDESSAAALHYVLRMNRYKPVFAIIAARELELQDNQAMLQALSGLRGDQLLSELTLGPLDNAALIPLIKQYAPQADSDKLARESGGNPLLAIELARAVTEGASSQSLQELMQERLSRLPAGVADVLQWAAVLEPHLELRTLKRVSNLSLQELDKAIVISEQQGILSNTSNGLHFSHHLIGQSIYQALSSTQRQFMHNRAAQALEVETALDLKLAAELAHHAEKSGDAALAAKAMVSAGRLCMRFFAHQEAIRLANKGLAFAQALNDIDRVCVNLELYEIIWTSAPVDNWREAAEHSVMLAETALDHGALPFARLGYQLASYLRWLHGDWKDAQRDSLQAERVTRGGSEKDQVQGMAEAAKCLALLEKDLSQADAMLMEARSLANRKQMYLPAISLATGILRYYNNDFQQAVDCLEEARSSYKANGERISEYQALEYLVMIEIERNRFDDAQYRCRQLTRLGEKFNDGSERSFAQALSALCHYALSKDDTLLDQPLADLRVCDAKHRLSYTLIRAALIDLNNQRPDKALVRGEEALAYTELLKRPSEQMLAHLVLAQAYQHQQQEAASAKHIEAIDQLDKHPVAGWARERAVQLLPEFE